MATVVKYLHRIDGRWKYRKAIPARLRPFIDGNIGEFVRWLGPAPADGQPSPKVLRRYVEVGDECAALLEMAEKRASGTFDQLNSEVIEHFIATLRSHMLEEDEEERFDETEDEFFEDVKSQLEGMEGVTAYANPDRRWQKRQERLESVIATWRSELARGRISDIVKDELLDAAEGYGLRLDPDSLCFRRLAKRYLQTLIEVAEGRLQRQEGLVVPTPEAPPPLPEQQRAGLPGQTITGLVQDWWREAKAAGRSHSTLDAYSRAARQLSAFLRHDDANAITKKDIIAFKDHRLKQGKTLKTIGDGDLAAFKALFAWAVSNGRMTANPAADVKVVAPKRVLARPQGFTDAEAEAILTHARKSRKATRAAPKTTAAKRWVPWLCAHTGARVGEMVQLRKQDLRKQGDIWVLTLTPEAGAIKSGLMREVPLHPQLVEEGFPEFVASAPEGYLFLNPKGDTQEDRIGAIRTIKNRVTDFVREVVTDPKVQPNHGWRHRFETLAREAGLREDVTNAITGHATPGVAATYGNVSIKAKAEALARMPHVNVQGDP